MTDTDTDDLHVRLVVTVPNTDADTWFDQMQAALKVVHDVSHENPRFDSEQAAEIATIMQTLIDLAEWLSNSTSWDNQCMYNYDRQELRNRIRERLGWRLERSL